MKTITINAPEGKVIGEEKTKKGMVITFHDVPKPITERVKTLEDALNEASEEVRREYGKWINDGMPEHLKAYLKLVLITSVLNEGWEADYKNKSQYKYWLWWHYNSAGLWYALFCASSGVANADVGARLCFKSEALARHAAEHFVDLYQKYIDK